MNLIVNKIETKIIIKGHQEIIKDCLIGNKNLEHRDVIIHKKDNLIIAEKVN